MQMKYIRLLFGIATLLSAGISSAKQGTLLFFFSDEGVSACSSVIPTLSWLAEKSGADFENYVATAPLGYGNCKMLPFTGNQHMQQFLYLCNFYDRIAYCAITSRGAYQFRREVKAFGGDVVSCRRPGELAEFYRDVFAYFRQDLPSEAVVLPKAGRLDLAPFCYPEVLFRRALGVPEDEWSETRFAALGVKSVAGVFCMPRAGGLRSVRIDTLSTNDTYGTATARIAERWADRGKGAGFINPGGLKRWTGKFCRDKVLALYQPTNWMEYLPTVVKYAKRMGNDTIVGNQMTEPPADNVATEFSKLGVIMNLVGVDPRLGTTLQTKHPLPVDWLKDAKAPWEDEYSDEFLRQKLKEHAIPVCFLFYAADLGHISALPRFLDLMGLEGLRAGIAFPALWYDYAPELVEQIYIPRELGGVFPQLEPLMASGGLAVISEAKGFLTPEGLTDLLNRAQRKVAGHVGERLVPIGYYPFQDADPYYFQKGEPQYDAVAKVGFDYYITYFDQGKSSRIVGQVGKMTILNQQTQKWFPWFQEGMGDEHSKGELRKLEGRIAGDADEWIVMTYDTPFFGLSPIYLGGIRSKWDATGPERLGMQKIVDAMMYVRNGGGDSKRLFLVKPHELVRYARLRREADGCGNSSASRNPDESSDYDK